MKGITPLGAFPGGVAVTNPPADAEDTGNVGSVPGLGRSLEEEMTAHSGILTWEIPQTEEPGGLQSIGWQRVGHNSAHTHRH